MIRSWLAAGAAAATLLAPSAHAQNMAPASAPATTTGAASAATGATTGASAPGAAPAVATDIHVMISGGFTAAYTALAPTFAAQKGVKLDTAHGPSMGQSPEAIPNRLTRGEHADVVIMVGYALDDLIKKGAVDPNSRVELADSRIGMVVREGATVPDIRTVDALRRTLMQAKSIAYSDSASGVYVERELFAKLGEPAALGAKAKKIEKIPVASVVANGQYEIGFQQVAELLPVPGVTFAGRIPEEVQSVTRFAGGVPVKADHPAEARALLEFLAAPAAQQVVKDTGLDSVPH